MCEAMPGILQNATKKHRAVSSVSKDMSDFESTIRKNEMRVTYLMNMAWTHVRSSAAITNKPKRQTSSLNSNASEHKTESISTIRQNEMRLT